MVSDPAAAPTVESISSSIGDLLLDDPDWENGIERYVPESPDELESHFQQRLKDYNDALKDYASEPGRLSDCQDELIQVMKKFRTIKKVFQYLYPELVKIKAFESMVGLLKNDDCGEYLAWYILLTFKELTDVEFDSQEEAAEEFVGLLLEYGTIPVFVSVLGRFPEKGDNADHDIDFDLVALQTIVHMMFIEPDVADIVCKQTKLVNWVLDKLRIDDRCDHKKQYAVGLLCTLLQPTTRYELGEMGAVDVVVRALLPYASPEEEEKHLLIEEQYLLDNLFQCLFSILLVLKNRVRFAEAGGVDYMIKIIKQKNLNRNYYGFAIATLDLALIDCPYASDKFVDASGLDIAFPAPADMISECNTHDEFELEQHLISLIASLACGIAETKKEMLLSKFEENDSSKTTWLMELFIRDFNIVAERAKEGPELALSELYDDERLPYGLSTLMPFVVILGYISLYKKSKLSARIEEVLCHHSLKKKDVRDILLPYRDQDIYFKYRDHINYAGIAAKTMIKGYIDSLEKNPDQ